MHRVTLYEEGGGEPSWTEKVREAPVAQQTKTELSNIYTALSSPVRRRIVEFLSKEGPRELKDIAAAVGLREITARHHLMVMERAGLVSSAEHHSGLPGRPRLLFEVCGEHHDLSLPRRQYQMLSEHLIDELIDLGGKARAAEVMRSVGTKIGESLVAEALREAGKKSLKAEVVENFIVPKLDEFGSAAQVIERSGPSMQIRVNNCVFFELAKKYHDVVCAGHEALFQAIADAMGNYEVRQASCMACGAQSCITSIERRR
jgi:predicted ArsR family transcriptional regulator